MNNDINKWNCHDTVSNIFRSKSVTYTKIMLTKNLPPHCSHLQAIKISCRHRTTLRWQVKKGKMILLFVGAMIILYLNNFVTCYRYHYCNVVVVLSCIVIAPFVNAKCYYCRIIFDTYNKWGSLKRILHQFNVYYSRNYHA